MTYCSICFLYLVGELDRNGMLLGLVMTNLASVQTGVGFEPDFSDTGFQYISKRVFCGIFLSQRKTTKPKVSRRVNKLSRSIGDLRIKVVRNTSERRYTCSIAVNRYEQRQYLGSIYGARVVGFQL